MSSPNTALPEVVLQDKLWYVRVTTSFYTLRGLRLAVLLNRLIENYTEVSSTGTSTFDTL